MPRHPNLQDDFLNQLRKKKTMIMVYLTNGAQVRGTVCGFDSFTVLLDVSGRQQLVYKHAMSTFVPSVFVPLEENNDG